VSAKIDDGGPAFPMTGSTANWDAEKGQYVPQYGMTLRDWFAGQALGSILKSCGDLWCYYDQNAGSKGDNDIPSPRAVASYTYELADAMLAARKGGSND
jgi:hypothetical protein